MEGKDGKEVKEVEETTTALRKVFSSPSFGSSTSSSSPTHIAPASGLKITLVVFRTPTTTCRHLRYVQPNILWSGAHFFLTTIPHGTILRLQTRYENARFTAIPSAGGDCV
jgi:hypothetical protein